MAVSTRCESLHNVSCACTKRSAILDSELQAHHLDKLHVVTKCQCQMLLIKFLLFPTLYLG